MGIDVSVATVGDDINICFRASLAVLGELCACSYMYIYYIVIMIQLDDHKDNNIYTSIGSG